MGKRPHRVFGTPNQAIRTLGQKAFEIGFELNQSPRRSEANPGSTIKRSERAIIRFKARERQGGRMNTSPT
jgi:hypothetical protein